MSPKFGPIKRRELIDKLKALGFHGPYPGAKHEYMTLQSYDLRIPSYDEYDPKLHRIVFKEVCDLLERDISRDEWSKI